MTGDDAGNEGTVTRRSVLQGAAGAGAASVAAALADGAHARTAPPSRGAAFEVGAARVDASPTPAHLAEGVFLGGYGVGPVRPAEGVHDGCTARSLAVTVDDEGFVFVVLDLIGIGNRQIEAIRAEMADRTDLDRSQVLVAATHTHSGPDFQGLWGGVPESYREYVVDRAIEACVAAFEYRLPASARVGDLSVKQSFTRNRRGWERTDNILTALQFVPEDGPGRPSESEPIATLVNYAAHPVFLGYDNWQVATDFVGPVERAVEDTHGGVGIYANGAIGDATLGPTDAEGSFASAREYGHAIADRATAALDDAVALEPAMLTHSATVRLSIDNCLFKLGFESGLLRPYYEGQSVTSVGGSLAERAVGGVSEPAGEAVGDGAYAAPSAGALAIHSPVARVRLGTDTDLELLTVPGEALTRLGEDLRVLMGGSFGGILGLTQNTLGYLVPEDEWQTGRNGNYEETVSLGPDTAPLYRRGARTVHGETDDPVLFRTPDQDNVCPETQAELRATFQDAGVGELAAGVIDPEIFESDP